MVLLEEKNYPELIIIPDYYNLETEIPTRNYKSVIIRDDYQHNFIDILKKHGGSVRKLDWTPNEPIAAANLYQVLSHLPKLEEINLDAQGTLRISTTTTKEFESFDLSHIKSLHCCSERSLHFFSLVMPSNCLEEFNMIYGYWDRGSTSNKTEMARFENFIKNQTSIKAFSTDRKISLSVLSLLTLEKLKFDDSIDNNEVIKVLKGQPELKKFEYENSINSEALEEVCNLSKLEVLTICVDKIENVEKLESLKNLKHLSLLKLKEVNQQRIFKFKMEELEKLNIGDYYSQPIRNSEILEIISLNFPNLKALELKSAQKLNYFAKIFPNLEELELVKFDELWELDTGIVNEKLRKLKLKEYESNYCIMDGIFLELFKIYPNLETLVIDGYKSCYNYSKNHTHFELKKFFEKFHNLDKLKSIDLSSFDLKPDENYLMEIAKELKKFAQKFKYVNVNFSDYWEIDKADYDSVKSNYDLFVNKIKEDYVIDRNRLIYHDLKVRFTLHITSGSKY